MQFQSCKLGVSIDGIAEEEKKIDRKISVKTATQEVNLTQKNWPELQSIERLRGGAFREVHLRNNELRNHKLSQRA
jgi:hypothetical protein